MKLEVNHKKKFAKTTNTWRLKNVLLKNEWVYQEIKEKVLKSTWKQMKMKTTVQNLWDAAKAVLRGKGIAIQAYLKEARKISNNLTFHLKGLENKQNLKPADRREW